MKTTLGSLKVGDQLKARIAHSIIAFSDEKSPVIATVESGNLEGAKLLGESRLEPNTKRIFITFNQIRVGGKVYAFKGEGLTSESQPGFEGEYHSREATYFTGDFISSLVAAYFDGLVPRTTNVLGAQVEDTSVDSAFKKGLAGGAMASANRFKEKLKKVPEFSELEGPIKTEVLVNGKGIDL